MRSRLSWCLNVLAALAISASATSIAHANPVLLFEPATGRVLYAEQQDHLWYPASVTKLMTAYLTFEAVRTGRLAWDDDVPLSEHARSQPATRIGLRVGIPLNVEQAVRGLILRSANDFAVALAERVGGNEEAFVRAMNDTARRLGMTRTVFRNPHGLPDPEQVTTARDLATLTTALLRDFADRAEVFSTQSVRIYKGTFYSQNELLKTLEGADGMKTGFTCASGYNIVASATRNGRKLVAIVLGEYNRQRRSARVADLMEAGFAHLATDPTLASAVVVPAVAPIKLRHAKADFVSEPHPFMPVTLRNLPLGPAASDPAGNIGRDVRARTCRGYSGFTKPEPEPEIEAENTATPVVTGTLAAGAVKHPHRPATTTAARPRITRHQTTTKPTDTPANKTSVKASPKPASAKTTQNTNQQVLHPARSASRKVARPSSATTGQAAIAETSGR